MKILKKLKKNYSKGKELSMQMVAAKQRAKMNKKVDAYAPGTIRYGLFNRQRPLAFMKTALELRRYKRRKKYEMRDLQKKQNNNS